MTRRSLAIKHRANAVSIVFLFIIGFLFQSCPTHRPKPPMPTATVMTRLQQANYPDFTDDMAYDGLIHAIDRSLAYLQGIPNEKKFSFGHDQYSAAHLIKSFTHFRDHIAAKPPPSTLNDHIRTHYIVYKSVGKNAEHQVLYTGYYEPNLRGSLRKTDIYQHPVYARPTDLATVDLSLFSTQYKNKNLVGRVADGRFIPYFDRDAISEGALAGNATPVAWVDDEIDLFFLQIQGSGKIYLDTGGLLNVHYHLSNGKPYRSIGKLLIDENKIPRSEMSMQRIRAYLKAHPEEIGAIFSYNPSYVFFKTETDGPLGCLDVKLTPGRSLALDRRIFPLPSLSFIQTQKPLVDGDGIIAEWTDCARFMLNQDTGGAIRGPGRGDVFWGNGEYAELAAGHMQHSGKLYFLVLRPDAS